MTRAPLRLTLAAAVLAAVLALPPVSGPGILVIELPLLLAALCLIGCWLFRKSPIWRCSRRWGAVSTR